MKKANMIGLGLLFLSASAFSQEKKEDLKDWYLRDYSSEVRGINVNKAYKELLQNKTPQEKIVVAVIDSGIDINHEDLKDVIWVNKDEIPNNGIDDDKNGFIDDVNGWNFLGNTNGDMVNHDNLEVSRMYKKLSAKWEGKSASEIKKEDLADWKLYQKVKNNFKEGKDKATKMKAQYDEFATMYYGAKKVLTAKLDENFTAEDLNKFKPETEKENEAKTLFSNLMSRNIDEEYLTGWKDYVDSQNDWYYNPDVDVRRDIIKDDPNNLREKGYGNNNVYGPEASHGTHVAGTIAAVRNNKIGMDGIAGNVEIMPVRTVPGGDEHDKDVANAIFYAVDNGARVINMSFGKAFSPNEAYVAEAIQYANKKGVLLIHAAGNSSENIDKVVHYPTNYSKHIRGKMKTYITVGASSLNSDKSFPASFTNYGAKSVDIFAPGVDIYSTYPENDYHFSNGTSMATPVVSGVAALILSYYPDLSGKQVKKILEKSSRNLDEQLVYLPGTGGKDEEGNEQPKETVKFEELTRKAGLIDAYKALQLADKKSKY